VLMWNLRLIVGVPSHGIFFVLITIDQHAVELAVCGSSSTDPTRRVFPAKEDSRFLLLLSQVLCKVVHGPLSPRHAFHDGHDFQCPGHTGRIAHRFPHFAVGGFRISSRHRHRGSLASREGGKGTARGLGVPCVHLDSW
jgi:hypothetical protein